MILTTCLRRLNTCKRLGFAKSLRIFKERHKTYTFNRAWRKKYAHATSDIHVATAGHTKIRTLGPCLRRDDPRSLCTLLAESCHTLLKQLRPVLRSFNEVERTGAKTGHTWQDIAQQQGCTPSFEQFFNQQCARSLPVLEPLFASITDDEYRRRADEYVNNEFSLLGSEKRVFDTGIPWHEDIRLSGQDASSDAQFDATSWYADIRIATNTETRLGKDIKVPWELSRLRHLVVLGRAYTTTYDERYATTFAEHVRSWMSGNPFLQGINWTCPMEVALRAINLVIAFTSFRRSPVISDEFWLAYVTNLYDHMIYLENNWELYDLRTSNHYIADLVGYLYLCWFFNDCPAMASRITWCHQELLAELDKQINADGSSYEQATAYHRLVAELFYHHQLISQQLRLSIPAESQQKFGAMCTYLQWCTPNGGELITIGDNDSGVVTVAGLPDAIIAHISNSSHVNEHETYGLRNFDNAGLSIIKTASWHVSLRHSVYHEQAPTGHMHNDATSITLAYSGVPFIVDPGSYVYTPSIVWRNLFRSVQSHSGMYLFRLASTINPIESCQKFSPGVIPAQAGIQAHVPSSWSDFDHLQPIEPVSLDDNIFLLRRTPATMPAQSHEKLSMRTTHDDYLSFGYRPERRVTLDEQTSTVTLHDQWYVEDPTRKNQKTTTQEDSSKNLSVSNDGMHTPLYACFQFVLHPDVKATKITKLCSSGNNAIWLLESGGITLELSSDNLAYELRPAWYSPEYGVKVATQMFFARYDLNSGASSPDRQFCTIIRFM